MAASLFGLPAPSMGSAVVRSPALERAPGAPVTAGFMGDLIARAQAQAATVAVPPSPGSAVPVAAAAPHGWIAPMLDRVKQRATAAAAAKAAAQHPTGPIATPLTQSAMYTAARVAGDRARLAAKGSGF